MRDRVWLPAVFGVEALLFLPALIGGGIIRAPLGKLSESTGLFYAWALFWRDEVRAGRAPFWNPYVFGGMPVFGEPQAHTFYPVHLLWLILPPELAFTVAFLAHLWLASFFMSRLARELGAGRFGAAIAALVYGLHGQIVAFIYPGWIHQVMPMAWAPGVVWMCCRALRSPDRWPGRSIAGAGVLLGIQITSGHPEWVRYTLFVLGLLAIGGVPPPEPALRRALGSRLKVTAAAVILGLLVSGVQLLPMAQAASHSARAQNAVATGDVRRGAGLPIVTLPTVIVPRLFGPWDQTISVDGLAHKLSGSLVSYSESLIYVGVLPLLLAIAAARRWRDTGARTWLIVAAAGILLALNDWTHLVSAFDRVVTLDATFRSPARFVFLTNLALAALAGLGAAELAEPRQAALVARLSLVLALVVAAGAALAYLARSAMVDAVLAHVHVPAYIAADPLVAPDGGRRLGFWAIGHATRASLAAAVLAAAASLVAQAAARRMHAAVRAAVFAAIAADLVWFAYPIVTRTVPVEQVYARDAELLAPVAGNPAVRVAAPHLDAFAAGDNVTIVFRVRSLIGYDSFSLLEWDRLWQAMATPGTDLLSAAGVTHVVTSDALGRTSLTPVDNPRGHIWWADRIEAAAAPEVTLDRAPPIAPGAATIAIDQDVPGRLRARVDAQTAGWLVLTEVIYPGWTARVNGAPVPLARAFGVFQAVRLPAGASTVEFAFRPAIVWWGAGLTLLGLAVAVLMARWGTARRGTPWSHPNSES